VLAPAESSGSKPAGRLYPVLRQRFGKGSDPGRDCREVPGLSPCLPASRQQVLRIESLSFPDCPHNWWV
jgi:hypothetical protein